MPADIPVHWMPNAFTEVTRIAMTTSTLAEKAIHTAKVMGCNKVSQFCLKHKEKIMHNYWLLLLEFVSNLVSGIGTRKQ